LPRAVKSGPVKTERAYDASRRRADAQVRRERVLASARELFLRHGFTGTTVAAIATAAGVSRETVYKTFGGKTGLIRALYRAALLGAGPVAAYERSDRLRSTVDPYEVVRGWSRLATEVGPRVTAVQLLVRDAALVDPDLKDLLAELDADRLTRMTENARFLEAAGHLRPGVDARRAADLMWTVTAPEMIELLVHRRGWSLDEYAALLYQTLTSQLLRPRTT
jgi:AcrR family transcriptional regulator